MQEPQEASTREPELQEEASPRGVEPKGGCALEPVEASTRVGNHWRRTLGVRNHWRSAVEPQEEMSGQEGQEEMSAQEAQEASARGLGTTENECLWTGNTGENGTARFVEETGDALQAGDLEPRVAVGDAGRACLGAGGPKV